MTLPTGATGRPAISGHRWPAVLTRLVVAVLGGYAASFGIVGVLSVWLPVLVGMARSEAVMLASMLGFVIYLVLLLYSMSERNLLRLGVRFALLAAVCFALVSLVHVTGG